MRTRLLPLACVVVLLGVLPGLRAGEAVPYGHPDFYPSAERPAQLRGDGTGHFPAATPVTKWDFRSGENIVWATRLPGWGYSSPIVVGDKVFVTCDWNRLLCLDARSGELLWDRANETYDLVGGGEAEELRAIFEKFTDGWLTAWQCCWEIAYLTWWLDVIEASRAGRAFEFPKGGYGHSGHKKKKGRSMARDYLTAEQLAAVQARAKALPAAEVTALRERLAALQILREENQWGPNVSAYVPRLSPYVRSSEKSGAYKKEIKEALKQLTPHGLFTDFWNGWLSNSFPTPVSDGEYVYAMWSQCQVACYDLEGERRWLRAFTEDAVTARLDQNYSGSPILAGNLVIVLFGGKSGDYIGIRALDKRTGEQVWYRKQAFKASSHPFPHLVRVRHEGIDAIATGAGAILRTADGKPLIENLPAIIAPPLPHENAVYYASSAGEASGGGSRLKVVLAGGDGNTAATIAWGFLPAKHKGTKWFAWMREHHPDAPLTEFPYKQAPNTNVGCILHDGRLLYGSNPARIIDAATGAVLNDPGKTKVPGGAARGHLTRAGPYLISTCKGTIVRVHALAEPAEVVAVNHIGSEWHRQIQLGEVTREEAVAAIAELPWLPNIGDWATLQTTPWPQGDRLYIRAKDSLFCVGDPSRPHHTPAAAPVAARTGD